MYHVASSAVSQVPQRVARLLDLIEQHKAKIDLLLGILDKATLTLGDNRRVAFSRTLIFMTSNLGAAGMGDILRLNLGFTASEIEQRHGSGELDANTTDKISKAGVEAARRKFTPEFMNRIDRIVVFEPLGRAELQKNSRARTRYPATAHLKLLDHPALCLLGDRNSERLPAARRDGHEVWSTSPSTLLIGRLCIRCQT